MSFRHVSAVLDHYPHGDSRKLILVAIAEQANEGTWVCWPSNRRIAARACVSERQVQRAVKTLESEGVLDVIRRRGRYQANRYRLRLDVLKDMPTLVDVDTPEDDSNAGFEPVEKTRQFVTHGACEPVDNSSENTTSCREKVTPRSQKHDIAMSPEPEEPEEIDLLGDAPVDNHGRQVVASMVGSLTDAFTRPSTQVRAETRALLHDSKEGHR